MCQITITIIDKKGQVGDVVHMGEKRNENYLKSFGWESWRPLNKPGLDGLISKLVLKI